MLRKILVLFFLIVTSEQVFADAQVGQSTSIQNNDEVAKVIESADPEILKIIIKKGQKHNHISPSIASLIVAITNSFVCTYVLRKGWPAEESQGLILASGIALGFLLSSPLYLLLKQMELQFGQGEAPYKGLTPEQNEQRIEKLRAENLKTMLDAEVLKIKDKNEFKEVIKNMDPKALVNVMSELSERLNVREGVTLWAKPNLIIGALFGAFLAGKSVGINESALDSILKFCLGIGAMAIPGILVPYLLLKTTTPDKTAADCTKTLKQMIEKNSQNSSKIDNAELEEILKKTNPKVLKKIIQKMANQLSSDEIIGTCSLGTFLGFALIAWSHKGDLLESIGIGAFFVVVTRVIGNIFCPHKILRADEKAQRIKKFIAVEKRKQLGTRNKKQNINSALNPAG